MQLRQVSEHFESRMQNHTSFLPPFFDETRYEDSEDVSFLDVKNVLNKLTQTNQGKYHSTVKGFRMTFLKVLKEVLPEPETKLEEPENLDTEIPFDDFVISMGKEKFISIIADRLLSSEGSEKTILQRIELLKNVDIEDYEVSGISILGACRRAGWSEGLSSVVANELGVSLRDSELSYSMRVERRIEEVIELARAHSEQLMSSGKVESVPELKRKLEFISNHSNKYKGMRPSAILCGMFPKFEENIVPKVFGEGRPTSRKPYDGKGRLPKTHESVL